MIYISTCYVKNKDMFNKKTEVVKNILLIAGSILFVYKGFLMIGIIESRKSYFNETILPISLAFISLIIIIYITAEARLEKRNSNSTNNN